MEISDTLKVRL